MISKQLIKISAALAVAVAFGSAGAQTLTATGNVFGSTAQYGVNNGAASGNYAPGRQFTYNGGSNFWAYCIDPGTGTILPSAYSTMSLDSFADGSATSAYAQQISRSGYGTWTGLSTSSASQAVVKNDLKELFSYAYNDAMSSANKAAAFGMAIWEIILQDGGALGNTYARSTGRLTSYGLTTATDNDAVETQTNTYLNALNSGGWAGIGLGTATNWNYTVYYDSTSPFSQTFLGVTTPGVPEPGTAALAALALFGAARFSRRRKQA
jgi:MYXO-CTERM domain-containing protein